VGDACVSSGFAKATHAVLDHVRHEWDVSVIGLNYWGDPHSYPYDVYPTRTVDNPYGDYLGVQRLGPLIRQLRPDLVVVQNDPWHFPPYLKAAGNTPVVGVVAVDGMNCRGNDLNGLRHAIFWTQFGEQEAKHGGYSGTSSVIPLGVDLNTYCPQPRDRSRMACGLPERYRGAFIVGNVNRNQPRKRLDLTVSFFAEWVIRNKVLDAYLFLHVAPTKDVGYDCEQLMRYYGMANRLIYAEPDVGQGVSERCLVDTYNSFDVLLSTTQGEGWGLPTLEAMACGVPCIVPDWSAHGEWARDAAWLIQCTEICCTPNDVNAIGGVPSRHLTIEALDRLYRDEEERRAWSDAALKRAREPHFRWENIGQSYLQTLDGALRPRLQIVGS
jgi:glycosyltransferase involved in cell wall biosynthesis